MAQRDEKLNFTNRCTAMSIAQRDEKLNFTAVQYLQLFNRHSGMKSWTLLTAVQWHSGMKSMNFTYRCSMAQRNEK